MVEIYTRIYIRNAGMSGKKMRTPTELNGHLQAWLQAGRSCDSSPTIIRPMRWSPRQGCAPISPIR